MPELLFEMHLKYDPEAPPVHEHGKVGEYIGSGTGRVEGPRLNGNDHWTLFEDVAEDLCQSNLFRVITTAEGAKIRFDSLGFFFVPDKSQPHLWDTSAAVYFEAQGEENVWLHKHLASWQGTFDMKAYRHHYKVFKEEI